MKFKNWQDVPAELRGTVLEQLIKLYNQVCEIQAPFLNPAARSLSSDLNERGERLGDVAEAYRHAIDILVDAAGSRIGPTKAQTPADVPSTYTAAREYAKKIPPTVYLALITGDFGLFALKLQKDGLLDNGKVTLYGEDVILACGKHRIHEDYDFAREVAAVLTQKFPGIVDRMSNHVSVYSLKDEDQVLANMFVRETEKDECMHMTSFGAGIQQRLKEMLAKDVQPPKAPF